MSPKNRGIQNGLSAQPPSTSDASENVSVCVRVKPIVSSPLSDIDLDTPTPAHRHLTLNQHSNRVGSWLIDPERSSISLSPSHPIIDRRGTGTSEAINGSEGYEFKLDQVLDPYSTTSGLYRSSVQSLIETCVKDGYNVTVFAYGQTGSGKTFTMMGSKEDGDDESLGVIPRAVAEVFEVIASDTDREYLLRVSYLEIYNEALKDLLAADQSLGPTNRLTIHEINKGRVHVNGIKEEVVTHPMQVLEALSRGEKARHVGATDWNERSSRSHTVFTMTIESRSKSTSSTNDPSPTQISQLNLIDLAGSESAATSTARRKEGAFINKSLLALSNVISKLSTLEPHIPYRDSKLTRLLQTSLSGNAKVVVICTVSADARSVVETLSTLRFARRAKMVVTKAQRGTIMDDKSALLQAYQREIMYLKAQLQENSQALSITTTPGSALAELNAEKSKAESELVSLRFERIRLQEQIEHLNRRILTSQTIQSNVRRAHSLQTPVSPTRRRIVSNHMPQPPKRNKGRVTDLGGMMGMLGIGLSTSGYVSNGSRSIEETQAQFQRELQLEKELKQVRSELNQLKLERSESPQELSQSGMESLKKKQIGALEADKENLPVGITEENQRTHAIKVFEDEMEMSSSEHQQELDSNSDQIENSEENTIVTPLQNQLNVQEAQIAEKVESATIDLQNTTRLQELQQQLESLRNEYDNFKLEQSALLLERESQNSNLEAELSSTKKEKDAITSDSHLKQELTLKLESDVNNLRTEKEELIRINQEQAEKLEKVEAEVASKSAAAHAVELDGLKKEHQVLMASQKELISKLETEKSDAQQKVDQLQSQLETELRSLQAAKEQSDLAQQQKQQELQEAIVKLETEKAEGLVKIQELQSQLEEKVSLSEKEKLELISNHQAQLVKLETEKSEDFAQVEELKTRLETDLTPLREKHENEIRVQKEQLALVELDRSSVREQLEELKSKMTIELTDSTNRKESDDQLVSSQQKITQLEAALLEARNKYETSKSSFDAELESLRKAKEDQFLAHQQEIAKLKAAEELKSKAPEDSQKIAHLEAALLEAETKYETSKSTFEAELESLRKGNEDLLSAHKEEITALQAACAKAESMVEELKSTVPEESQSLLQQKTDRILALENQVEVLQGELSRAQTKLKELNAKLESEIKSLHKDKEDSISSLKDQLEKLEAERSEALARIDDLTAADDSEEIPSKDQEHYIAELNTQLSEAKLTIDALTDSNHEKEECVRTLQDRISYLENELSVLGAKVNELTNEKVGAEENIKKLESGSAEQLKDLETEIKQLKSSLEDERAARLNTDVEFSEKSKNLESELASLSTLQTETSSLKTKLEKLEQRLSLERNKSQDKELELMRLMQELEQARGQIQHLETVLSDQDNKAQESVQSAILEWEGKLNQAENLADQSQSKIVDLNKKNETLEPKLRLFESETHKLQVDLEKLRTERTSQEIQQEKLARLSSRLQEDLRRTQEKEKDSMEKIESIVVERCAATSSRLQETYNSKLMQLEESNSNLEKHIKSLESHLASVGSGQRQQTTAESMETIVDLQSTIDDQNREIKQLKSELENVKVSLATTSARPLQSLRNNRSDHDHYHQSTGDELNRLYHIIDEQEKRLSDAKTDLSKWQARVRSQTELISKLKITSESDSEPVKLTNTVHRRTNSSTDHPMITTSAPHSTMFNNLNCRSPTKPIGLSPLLGSGPRSSTGHLLSSSVNFGKTDSPTRPLPVPEGSPRPLPIPESFIFSIDDDDAQRRKNRRRTIEKDMARLKDENVVERKLNSLLCSSTFRDTIPSSSSPLNRKNSISNSNSNINSNNYIFKPSHISIPSSNGFKNNLTSSSKLKRHSGHISPTASTFSSVSSQRGYYE